MARRRTMAFPQRFMTNFLLLPRLFSPSFCSTMITGTTKLNMMVSMMPGTMKKMKPTVVKMLVIIPATSRDANRESVKLNACLRLTSPRSIRSKVHLTTIPSAIVAAILLMTDIKITIAKRNAINLKYHWRKFSGETTSSGIEGSSGKRYPIAINMKIPLTNPATMNGIKN